MFEEFSHTIISMIEDNMWIGPLLALIAGLCTSLTPCGLSNIPLITGFVAAGDREGDTRRSLVMSLIFAIGAACTFIILGVLAAEAGIAFGHSEILHIILGILMLLMALQMWGVINIIPHAHGESEHEHCHGNSKVKRKKSFVGVFFTGMLGGIFSSHCAIPVILMLLTLASQSGSFMLAVILLLFYSIGHGVIIVIAGTSVGFANRLQCNGGEGGKAGKVFRGVLGAVMAVLGIYMLLG